MRSPMNVSCLLSTCDVSSISKSMYLKTCQGSRLTVWMPFCFTSSHHVFWLCNSSKFRAINGQRTLRYCMILLLLGKNYFWPDDIGLITRCLSTHCSTVCKSVRPTKLVIVVEDCGNFARESRIFHRRGGFRFRSRDGVDPSSPRSRPRRRPSRRRQLLLPLRGLWIVCGHMTALKLFLVWVGVFIRELNVMKHYVF